MIGLALAVCALIVAPWSGGMAFLLLLAALVLFVVRALERCRDCGECVGVLGDPPMCIVVPRISTCIHCGCSIGAEVRAESVSPERGSGKEPPGGE